MVNEERATQSRPQAQQRRAPRSPSLLATKLYVPRVRAGLVPRPRLTQRLDDGLQRRLTLVSAPAGFGKSTLIAEWAGLKAQAAPPLPLAWLSLDAADSDPVRFWAYFTAALQRVQPGVGQEVLALLRTPQPPPIEALLTQLLNEVAAIAVDFALVLDDYHAIGAQAIHDALAFLVEHLPPQMHLIVASRADPPLPLPLLRSRGQLVELRAADLRFTPDEAAAFLNRAMGLALAPEEIAVLDARTEGWVAGLQLAALSMQEVDDRSAFVHAFGGSHRYLLDYLAEEILDRQPEALRSFLLHTAILERLSGPLCDAVTEGSEGQAMLERLEQANLFVVPLDQERRWYRYHHLFAEFLRGRLARTEADAVPALHRRAATWYAQRGLAADAVGHALAAGDQQMAADLVERAAPEMFTNSELITLRGWLETLHVDATARPRLAMIEAWATVATGAQEAAVPLLDAIERGLQAAGSAEEVRGARAEVAAARAAVAMNSFDLQKTIALCRQVEADLAGDAPGLFNTALALRGAAAFSLGLAYEFSGDVRAASEALAKAAELSHAAGNMHIAPMALSRLAKLQVVQGQLRLAAQTFQQALRLAQEMSEHPSPMAGQVYTGYGDLLRERNDLQAALHYLEEGIELGCQWRNAETQADGYVSLAQARQALGDPAGALQAIEELATLLQNLQVPWMPPLIEAGRVRLWAAQGQREQLTAWLQARASGAVVAPEYFRESEQVAMARALLALGRTKEAAALLERLREAAEAGARMGRVVEILALRALALQAEGEAEGALAVLERALQLAEPEGYVRVFLDEGEPMAELLRELELEQRRELKRYVAQLLAAADDGGSHHAGPTQPLVEPLSERELEVLRKIAAGLSNQEIAQALVVSLNTVKTHVRNIYAKLGVGSRTQAVARARELRLL